MSKKISRKGAKAQSSALRWLPAGMIAAFCLVLSAYCLLPTAFSSRAQTEPTSTAAASPQSSPAPSPSPSPTPVTGLHQWGAVTLFHGLPSDRVHAIAQDADGVMWFGTEAGLAKFDGRRTQAVTDPELPNGRVLALQTDQDGSLWIGTESGAARLAKGKFEQIEDLAGKTINAIIAPERSHAIMVTEQGMVYDCHIDPVFSASEVEGLVRRAPADPGIKTKQLLATPLQSADADRPGLLPLTSLTIAQGKLLVGSSSRGVMAIENGSARSLEMRPQAYFIRALETDQFGGLWVGSKSRKEESGFYESEDATRIARVDSATGPVTALRFGGHSDIWVGSDGRGVFHFTSPKNVVRFTFDGTLGGLRSDHVYAIFVDREEVVWFGTDRGVSRFDPHAPRVESLSESAESNFVRALHETADGQLLAGTNRGLFVYDKTAAAWHPVNALSRNIVYAVAEDIPLIDQGGQYMNVSRLPLRRFLIGSASGFYASQFDRFKRIEGETFARFEAASGNVDAFGSVRAITSFRGDSYIASFGRGVERVEWSRTQLVWSGSTDAEREVISLHGNSADRLLIGTTNDGVFVFDGHETKTDPAFSVLKGSAVRGIDQSNDGTLWFATSRGVYACRPSAACLSVAPGVNARSIVAINGGKGGGGDEKLVAAWCATAEGLLKILIDDNVGAIVSLIDAEQGLPSQNVFAMLPLRHAQAGEQLLIGTGRGIARYEPGRMAPTLAPARIISKRVHQPEELRTGLNLEYPQNSLLLDVTATSSRTFPEQFQYAFLLADNKGRVIKQKLSRDSQFTMEGLKPGKYKATVRAFTKDLVASNPLSFELNVAGAPFPWTSTALAVLLILALLALMWAVLEHRRIVRTSAALVSANRELAGARLDLANEAERERRRIARDLHDQTLADLRRLLLITDSMPGGAAHSSGAATTSDQVAGNGDKSSFEPAAFRKEIESVSNEIRRICEDLSPSVLDNVGLAAALEWALASAAAHLPPEKKFEYEVIAGEEIEERIKLEPGERIQIYRIAQEIINNICRHSTARQVRLELKTSAESNLTLTIEDDGEFFAPADLHAQGRGLANIHARASLIEAEVAWSKRPPGGTMFCLKKVLTVSGLSSASGLSEPPAVAGGL
jgi:signal transduction histidine kinase/ligand-binding sensor domain-containing protein